MLSLTLETLVTFFADEDYTWLLDAAPPALHQRMSMLVDEHSDENATDNQITLIDSDTPLEPGNSEAATASVFVSHAFPPGVRLNPMLASSTTYSLDLRLLIDNGSQLHSVIVSNDRRLIARLRDLAMIRNRATRRPSGTIDLSTGIAARNVYKPETYGGFVLRWIGPEPMFRLDLDRHLLPQSRNFAISFEITLLSGLPPQCLDFLVVQHNDTVVPHLVIKKGEFYTVLLRLEEFPSGSLGHLTLIAPLSVTSFPEAFNPGSRLFSLGLLSIEFFAEARGQNVEFTPPDGHSNQSEAMRRAVEFIKDREDWQSERYGSLQVSKVKNQKRSDLRVHAVSGAIWRDIFIPQIIWRPTKLRNRAMVSVKTMTWKGAEPLVRSIIWSLGEPEKKTLIYNTRTGRRHEATSWHQELIKDVEQMIGAQTDGINTLVNQFLRRTK